MLGVILLVALGLRVGYAASGWSYEPPDSIAYERIAANLYEDHEFSAADESGREPQPSSTYAPGLPLFVAALYWLTGGVHVEFARIVLALFGTAAVGLTYLLGRRLGGTTAGLIGAGALAIFPALLEYQGLLLTEPLAGFLLAGALVLFLRAHDEGGIGWWIGAGATFGALALVRPEYLPVGVVLAVVAAFWGSDRTLSARLAPALAMVAAAIVVIAPWTARNAVELDRFVPVSTGQGKALYIGTYLDADGDAVKLRGILLERYPHLAQRLERGGPIDDPQRYVLERLLARVAEDSHPGVDEDVALGRLGRDNLGDDITDHPAGFAGMLAAKAFDTWTDPARAVMEQPQWRLLQYALLIGAIAGLVMLGLRGQGFECLVLALILLHAAAIGALLIASPRRELVVLPVLAALAGVALSSLARLRQ